MQTNRCGCILQYLTTFQFILNIYYIDFQFIIKGIQIQWAYKKVSNGRVV
jgi:hypothetical protein